MDKSKTGKLNDILKSGRAPGIGTRTRGTALADVDESRLGGTAAMKMRRKLLQTQGARALEHSYKQSRSYLKRRKK